MVWQYMEPRGVGTAVFRIELEELPQAPADADKLLASRADQRKFDLELDHYRRHALLVQGHPGLDIEWGTVHPAMIDARDREIVVGTRVYRLGVARIGGALPPDAGRFFELFVIALE